MCWLVAFAVFRGALLFDLCPVSFLILVIVLDIGAPVGISAHRLSLPSPTSEGITMWRVPLEKKTDASDIVLLKYLRAEVCCSAGLSVYESMLSSIFWACVSTFLLFSRHCEDASWRSALMIILFGRRSGVTLHIVLELRATTLVEA